MARGQTAEQMWEEYAKQCLPPDAPEIQVIETRKAFYAGAYSMWTGIRDGLDPGQEATDADVRHLDELVTEIETWIMSQAGRDVSGAS